MNRKRKSCGYRFRLAPPPVGIGLEVDAGVAEGRTPSIPWPRLQRFVANFSSPSSLSKVCNVCKMFLAWRIDGHRSHSVAMVTKKKKNAGGTPGGARVVAAALWAMHH